MPNGPLFRTPAGPAGAFRALFGPIGKASDVLNLASLALELGGKLFLRRLPPGIVYRTTASLLSMQRMIPISGFSCRQRGRTDVRPRRIADQQKAAIMVATVVLQNTKIYNYISMKYFFNFNISYHV